MIVNIACVIIAAVSCDILVVKSYQFVAIYGPVALEKVLQFSKIGIL